MAREHHKQQGKQKPLSGSRPHRRRSRLRATSQAVSMALFALGLLLLNMRPAAAGTCWQTHLGSGKCSQIFSTNITKSECCGASQTFSYTDRELSSVEYFFATAIGGGVECAPCIV
ncbi:follistatin [Drosophila persimilis]|uniref:follistatin n=1 Tax=Drosophila persimilis TaxID=7234 RepID=UPI000F097F76|nr:follistatin [Drosophila persimilis]